MHSDGGGEARPTGSVGLANRIQRLTHDLKSELNALLGFSELLQHASDSFDPRHRKFVQAIQTSATKILDRINREESDLREEAGRHGGIRPGGQEQIPPR